MDKRPRNPSRFSRRRVLVVFLTGALGSVAGLLSWATPRRRRELWLGAWLHQRWVQMTLAPYSIPAGDLVAALRAAGADSVVTVPDFVQFSVHARLEEGEPGLTLVRACSEEQAVNVAAGLAVGGRRPVVLIQNQGFYACVNAVRALGLDAQIPMVLMIGQFGREFSNLGRDRSLSSRRMVRMLEPMLETMGIPFVCLERRHDAALVNQAFDLALERNGPAALLVGAYTT